jgi:hypothetical protein
MKTKLFILLAFVLGAALGFFSERQTIIHSQPGKGSSEVEINKVNMSSGFEQRYVLGSVVGFSCVQTAQDADTDHVECFIASHAN